ncbi:hypothetical protein BJ912DRAFT_1057476 [Pholiota molesta]|nr:hypothetical protein BJ912DRAFT_1057476 [Pholiota molesta]
MHQDGRALTRPSITITHPPTSPAAATGACACAMSRPTTNAVSVRISAEDGEDAVGPLLANVHRARLCSCPITATGTQAAPGVSSPSLFTGRQLRPSAAALLQDHAHPSGRALTSMTPQT